MESFLRLNLMTFISVIGFFIVCVAVYHIIMKYDMSNDNRKRITRVTQVALLILFLFLLAISFSIIRQVLVNNIPRSNIDRSYQDRSQEKYQNNLNKKVKQE